jgi:hypothetical protein
MRILLCNYEYPRLSAGGGVFTAHLAQELAKQHEVTVLTSQGLGAPADRVENGVRVVRVPVFLRKQQATDSWVSMISFMLMGSREGKKLLKNQSFDVINTHFVVPLNNQDLFRDRCKHLIENAELCLVRGEYNKPLVEEFYIGKCAVKYETVFSHAVKTYAAVK